MSKQYPHTLNRILPLLPAKSRAKFLQELQGRQEQQHREKRFKSQFEQAREGNPFPLIKLLWPTLQLDDWQQEAISKWFDPRVREMFIKGNTGCGKTAIIGICAILYFLIWDDACVVLTRDKHETARRIVFGEVVSWWSKMVIKFDYIDVQAEKLVDRSAPPESHYIAIANPKSDEGFSGVHSGHVAHFYDEGTAEVLQPRYKLSYTQAHKLMSMGNPRTTSGEFHRAFPTDRPNQTRTVSGPYGLRHCVTVSGRDCRNVREKCLKFPVSPPGGVKINGHHYPAGADISPKDFAQASPIIPGQTCYDEYLYIRNHPDPDYVRCYAEGHFPEADMEVRLFNPQHVTVAQEAYSRWENLLERAESAGHTGAASWLQNRLPVDCFGLDVASSEISGDWSVLTPGSKLGMRRSSRIQLSNSMDLSAWVIRIVRSKYGIDLSLGDHPVCIDYGGGYGRGVGDRLRELGVWVIEFHPSGTSEVNSRKYENLRCEAYSELANRIDPDASAAAEVSEGLVETLREQGLLEDEVELPEPQRLPQFMLPADQRLFEDLTVLEKHYRSDGIKYKLTPKQSAPGHEDKIEPLKKRLGRSPDDGDSASYCWHAAAYVKESLTDWIDAGAF